MPLLGHHYPRLTLSKPQRCLTRLDLKIVGGLKKRGWTKNDIDVVGDKEDVRALAERLRRAGIKNPVHYCGQRRSHSHFQCIYYGLKLALVHKGY